MIQFAGLVVAPALGPAVLSIANEGLTHEQVTPETGVTSEKRGGYLKYVAESLIT